MAKNKEKADGIVLMRSAPSAYQSYLVIPVNVPASGSRSLLHQPAHEIIASFDESAHLLRLQR